MKKLWLLAALVLAFGCNEDRKRPDANAKARAAEPDSIPITYINPVYESLNLAGSFGELRRNHFHTGIDIKTCGEEGLPVMAAADGYISRIQVSGKGYGNAIYIDHPNRTTTVYAHLWRFMPEIQAWVRAQQYKEKSFEVNLFPKNKQFPVKQGQIIALSGNTGGSKAPHVHFEIRGTKSEHPLNPLLYGFEVPDTIAPVIKAIKAYPLDSGSQLKVWYYGARNPRTAVYGEDVVIDVYRTGGEYKLKGIQKIEGWGSVGFAIQAQDQINESYNVLGVYQIELSSNGSLRYSRTMKELNFDTWRFINAHVDYQEYIRKRRWFERAYLLPNNQLHIYGTAQHNGALQLSPAQTYSLSFTLKDAKGNTTTLPFEVTGMPVRDSGLKKPEVKADAVLPHSKDFTLKREDFEAEFEEGTFYELVPVEYEYKEPKRSKFPMYSGIHTIGNHRVPMQKPYTLRIKADDLPKEKRDKAIIISTFGSAQGGEYKRGWVETELLTLGSFFITTDEEPPIVKSRNIKEGAELSVRDNIEFVIYDKLSGVDGWKGTIDGKWVLFQYDAKEGRLYYEFDEYAPPGPHELKLEVWDEKGNKQILNYHFTRTI